MDLISLETWLKEKAGLNGAKLTLAVNACKEELVDSVQDLLELHDVEGLREVFSQGMIRAKVESALEQDKDNIRAQDDSATNEKESPKVSSSSAAIRQTEQQTQPQSSTTKNADHTALPPNKLYHFFASHKVRSVFDVCLTRLYVIIFASLLFRNCTLFMARYQKLSREVRRIGWNLHAAFGAFSM